MRRVARAHLRLWSIPESVEEKVVLAVSELITNAIEHGVEDDKDDRAICLRALYACGRLRVEVADGNPSPAVVRFADDDEESGRGLFLVAAFSTDWGVSEDGETTWCEFNVPVGRP
jgi:anti-sigma regulatory factor (Ser/Thr protein kinase)